MKICGTVRRPVFSASQRRAARLAVTSMSSNGIPRLFKRSLARMQYGQMSVE
jgi:hypothetical protein